MSPLVELNDLSVRFPTDAGVLHAVNDVSLSVRPGEILGIVGESGSGKSVTCLSLLGLLGPRAAIDGQVRFDGGAARPMAALERLPLSERPAISMIFQDPATSLNPVRSIGSQIAEVLRFGRGMTGAAARRATLDLLEQVGIPDPATRFGSYPHQMSGGMNQRIMIAMALAAAPRLLIADEPTTALDVTIQAQICRLLRELVDRTGLAVIFVSHDLDLVAGLCDRVAVMYAGSLVEIETAQTIVARPRHPYTSALLAAIPGHQPPRSPLGVIPGEIHLHFAPPAQCAFAPRCSRRRAECGAAAPVLRSDKGGAVACFNPH